MSRTPDAKDGEGDESLLDQELDEALKMTFPASDPVAIAAPGSTSRTPDPPSTRDRAAAKPAKRASDRSARREP